MITAAIAVLLFFVLLAAYLPGRHDPFEQEEYVLDTVVRVKIYDRNPSTDEDVARMFSMLRDFERTVDYYDQDSEISQLNSQLASEGRAPVEGVLGDLIRLSLDIARETGGAYDPTVGRLMDLWQFDKGGRLADKDEISLALRYTGYNRAKIKHGELRTRAGVKIDPGGISKGYAVDMCVEFLRSKGYRNFLINTVSSTAAYGSKDGKPFRVGIENPDGDGLLAVVNLTNGETMSTSGDYQRYFELDGRRYHHLLDPRTGYPAETFHLVTVVTTDSAAAADAYSTAVFVMGEQEGLKFAREKKLKVFAVTGDGRTIIYPEDGWIELLNQ